MLWQFILVLEIFWHLFYLVSCDDFLITCVGDDGTDFVTVEHCGDDFLAALADFNQDKEDWDDLQAIETEACGALNDIFIDTIPDEKEGENPIVPETYEWILNSVGYAGNKIARRVFSSNDNHSRLEVISQNDHNLSSGLERNEVNTIEQPSKPRVSYSCLLSL